MRECYHEVCDYPLNPGVKPDSLYFLAKATQALVLTLVELTGGRDLCNRDVFFGSGEEGGAAAAPEDTEQDAGATTYSLNADSGTDPSQVEATGKLDSWGDNVLSRYRDWPFNLVSNRGPCRHVSYLGMIKLCFLIGRLHSSRATPTRSS